ncbi:MAG TPA: hypothetical protein VHA75_21300 [Rugosimonospora sp.]|nr:hypothetical protein [Rugosimonospora sp.]
MRGFVVGSFALVVLYTLLTNSEKVAGANSQVAAGVQALLSGDRAALKQHGITQAEFFPGSGGAAPPKPVSTEPAPPAGTPVILV